MEHGAWELRLGEGPLVAVAVHAGHELREEVADVIALDEQQRLLEEDPHTDGWTAVADSGIVARRSRFEIDLNRPRVSAVYLSSADSWGLDVWRRPPPEDLLTRSLAIYDEFYAALRMLLADLERRFGRFIVYDLHSYNHRRGGPHSEPADPAGNPDVNVGTGSLDRQRWGAVVDRFVADLRAHDFLGRSLDVRENVRFRGGHLSQWVHETFPSSGCTLAIEVKKLFMDEHSGALDERLHTAVGDALQSTVPGVREELQR